MEAKIVRKNGSPIITINGEEYTPIPYRSFRIFEKNIKMFDEKGYKFFQVFPSGILNTLKMPYSNSGEIWLGEGKYDFNALKKHVDMFLTNSTDAKIILLLHLDTRDWFIKENPGTYSSFENLGIMCQNKKWRDSAARFIRDIIDYMNSKYPERVYQVHLFAGHTCEWYADAEPDKLKDASDFVEFYKNWFNDNRKIPSSKQLKEGENGVFRHPTKNKFALDFCEFFNDIIADTIAYFARVVKEHTNGKILVGVFYGYLMSFFHSFKRGHNAFYTVLNNKDIDIIFSPSAYRPFREIDSVNGFNILPDSITLHDKIYYHEIDNTTSLTINDEMADRIQSLHCRPANIDESITYAKRDSARALEHGSLFWWFDMWGCWFNNDKMMQGLEEVRIASERIYKKGTKSVSEIAVFVDAKSSRYMVDSGDYDMIYSPPGDGKGGIAVQYDFIYKQQDGLNRIGAPVSYYDSNDLCFEKFEHDKFKLYIFLNLFAPTKEIKEKIQSLRHSGKTILFLYAPGYVDEADFSIEEMCKLTGFDFLITNKEKRGKVYFCEDNAITWGGDRGITPIFTIKENDCEIKARYCDSNLPALAIKKRKKGMDIWCATGPIPAEVLRRVAIDSGVFIYHDGNDPVYINNAMIGMYSYKGGEKIISLPKKQKLISLYEKNKIYETTDNFLKLSFNPKEFKLLLRE